MKKTDMSNYLLSPMISKFISKFIWKNDERVALAGIDKKNN